MLGMIKNLAKMAGINKSDQEFENVYNKAINQAQSGNPLEGIDPNFLKQVQGAINTNKFDWAFKMAGVDKKSCQDFLNQQIGGSSPSGTSNNIDKYSKGMNQFKK